MLPGDLHGGSRPHPRGRIANLTEQRLEGPDLIAAYVNDDHPKIEISEIVLMFEAAIDGHEDVKARLGKG